MYCYCIKEDLSELSTQSLQEALQRLPDWRREQALRFKHTLGQAECAFSYLLLCELLQREYGIGEQPHFVAGPHGKPSLKEYPHVHFNMSHCKAGIVVAVSDHPVGVDIEQVGRGNDALARYAFNEDEYARFVGSDAPAIEFARLWTQKEAVAKLTGRGIDDNLKLLLSSCKDVEIETWVNKEKGYAVSIAQYKSCGK